VAEAVHKSQVEHFQVWVCRKEVRKWPKEGADRELCGEVSGGGRGVFVCEGGVSMCGVERGGENRGDERKDGVEMRYERGVINSCQAECCGVMSNSACRVEMSS
jgi:hypothetical protein